MCVRTHPLKEEEAEGVKVKVTAATGVKVTAATRVKVTAAAGVKVTAAAGVREVSKEERGYQSVFQGRM